MWDCKRRVVGLTFVPSPSSASTHRSSSKHDLHNGPASTTSDLPEKTPTVPRPSSLSEISNRAVWRRPVAPFSSIPFHNNSVPGNRERESGQFGDVLDITLVRAFAYKHEVTSVKFSMDGKYLALGLLRVDNGLWDGNAIIYDMRTEEKTYLPLEVVRMKKFGVCSLCFSPNGEWLAIGHFGGHVSIWLFARKEVQYVVNHHNAAVNSLDFSPNGQSIVSASLDGVVRIWNVQERSSEILADADAIFCAIFCARFSPNGKFVAIGDLDHFLRIWDSRTCRLVEVFKGHTSTVSGLAFLPDGKGLVTSSWDRMVKYWDVASLGDTQSPSGQIKKATMIRQFEGHTDRIHSIAISPDGRWALSASNDCTALIWNISNGVQQHTLRGHSHRISSVDISPAGNYFALGGRGGQVRLWRYRAI